MGVTVGVELPSGASNVRFFCITDGTFFNATYANGAVSGQLPHFSTWAIVYDLPADVNEDGDELPPSWHYVPQQQSEDNHTIMIVAACAAIVALLVLNMVRKNR